MFIGHYSASFFAKGINKKIPLWQLFIGVQFVDIIWAIFILLGIEKVRIVPGITVTSPLDLYFMPYTHSLIAVIIWSIIASSIYKFISQPKSKLEVILIGLVILSHWILDFIVHRPDLAIIDNSYKVGLGIWNYPLLTLAMEIGLLLISMLFYLKSFHTITTKNILVISILGIFFSVLQLISMYGPLPNNDKALALTALGFYFVLAIFIGWVERTFLMQPKSND